jgi:hypothetical protein
VSSFAIKEASCLNYKRCEANFQQDAKTQRALLPTLQQLARHPKCLTRHRRDKFLFLIVCTRYSMQKRRRRRRRVISTASSAALVVALSARALSCVMNTSQIMKRVSLSEYVKWKEQGVIYTNIHSPRRAAEEPGPDFQGWELRMTSCAAECLPRGVVFRSLKYRKISI